MRNRPTNWKLAGARGMAALMAMITVLRIAPATGAPGDIFDNPAPVLATEPGKAASVADGDTTVATQTGALNYSYPIRVPPGRNGMAPHLSLTYSSQAPIYGGVASGWNWNLSIPEIREDVSVGRMRTHYPLLEAQQADPKLDDRFVSSMAGGRRLILVSEPGDPQAYQYRAQGDPTFSRYERMKGPAWGFWWRVYGTDGSIRYFGDASLTAGCVNVSEGFAPLTREVDAFGSEIQYAYESVLTGECRIKSITYGQNAAAGIAAFAQIDIAYSPDQLVCGGVSSGSQQDFRTGKLIVTGASRLTTITSTAFAPGGSPASAVHTRRVALGYDTTQESCTLQHAPIKLLTTISESAWGTDSPLVALPAKTFTYNPPTTTLVPPATGAATPWISGFEDLFHVRSLAWGYRRLDERWPSVEAMLIDVDGDGLVDRLYNTSSSNGHTFDCSARWSKNMGVNAATGQLLPFSPRGPITLPRLKWRGPGPGPSKVAGASEAGADNHEGCSLNGMATAYRNSQGVGSQTTATCHDGTSCNAATDSADPDKYCNVAAPNKGTACPPAGGPDPQPQSMLTYLAYRWLDADSDGLIDLVTAVHGSSNWYDIERGNLLAPDNFTLGEPSISGIPGLNAWPPCPGAGVTQHCFDTGPIVNAQSCDKNALCIASWPLISAALATAPHVGCNKLMARPGPSGGGGGSGAPARAPYERCQGLYPWMIYKNRGNGVFDTVATVKYQPVPLESDQGDSSIGGPAIATTNHAIQDFDGDGTLDAVVHVDEQLPHGSPNAWQVWLGDRTGQIGPRMYYYPTRLFPDNRIAGLGLQGATISESSAGLLDFNGDGLPDHWRIDAGNNVNVALSKGVEQDLMTPSNGFVNTPLVGGIGVKPGNDSVFANTIPASQKPFSSGDSTIKNRAADVDGDGRIDVVRWNGGLPQVFWNYAGQVSATGVSYPGDTSGVQRRVAATEVAPDMYWELKGDLLDLDGDGRSEAASFPGDGLLWRAAPMYTQPPRLLAAVSNGRGATTAVTYASMHEAGVVEQHPEIVPLNGRPKASPSTQWVVKSITTSDAFTPGAATTSYVYKNPVYGADDEGRFASRGFEQVTTTTATGSRVVQRYGYVPDWSGRLATTVVMPKLGSGEGDGDARSIDRMTWEERQLFGGAVKTYHATLSEHLLCKNGQGDPTDPYGPAPALPCDATTAGGYSRTTSTPNALASTTSGNPTPLLWQETDTLLQAGTATADGDRATKTTLALAADATTYRLRPLVSLKTVRVANVPTTYAKAAQSWDASYRVPLTAEVWFDSVDGNRAITTRTYDMATGNVTQALDPRGNAITFEYDSRRLFVSAENQVYAHNYEYEYEYGTGETLVTRGPQVAACSAAGTCPGQLARDEQRIRVDGLGRTIERFSSVNPDPTLDYFALRKVELNSYVDVPVGAVPTSVTHQGAIKETAGVISYTQDKTELDGHGRTIRKTVFANGAAVADQITTYHYNPEGTVHDVTVPDPSQNTVATVQYDYTFDSLGRQKTIRRPDNTLAASRSGVDLTYDGVTTTATEIVGAAGGQAAITRRTDDGFGRMVTVEETRIAAPLTWAVTRYAYDANDNIAQITDAESKVTTLAHDFAGRRLAISRINGATTKTWSYGYDKAGNMVAETTPCTGVNCGLAYTTTTAYDAFNHPTSKLIAARQMSAADRTLFGADQETMIWDLNANGRGQLVQWRSFGGGTEAQLQWRTHDPQGRATMNWQSFNRAGVSQVRAIQHSYHLGGAPWVTQYGDFIAGGTLQTVSKVDLDGRGQPLTIGISIDNGVTFPTATSVRQRRNVAGRVTLRTGSMPPRTGSIQASWTYDVLGRVANQTVRMVSTTGAVTAIAQQAMTYHGNDDPRTLQHFLGAAPRTFTYAYDLRHQLTGVTTDTAAFFGASYGYGPAGRFTSATETRTATGMVVTDLVPRDVTYVYGGADAEQVTALTNVVGGARFATFTYDDAGNMLSRCLGATFTPTCAGELLEYLYDGKDQLRRVTRKVNGVVTGSEEYWYDADGNRTHVRKLSSAGVATELVWYLDEAEHHITPATSVEVRAFAHVSLGTPVARIDRTSDLVAPIEYQFHGLANNTLAAVAQATGAVNASFSYAPFGEVLDGTNAGGKTAGAPAHLRRFNDKVQDEVSGLAYYGARYYDKALIGWTQADPMFRFVPDAAWTEPRKANLYAAHLNNPLRYVDPDGRMPGAITVGRLAAEIAPLPPWGKVAVGVTVGVVVAVASELTSSSSVGDLVREALEAQAAAEASAAAAARAQAWARFKAAAAAATAIAAVEESNGVPIPISERPTEPMLEDPPTTQLPRGTRPGVPVPKDPSNGVPEPVEPEGGYNGGAPPILDKDQRPPALHCFPTRPGDLGPMGGPSGMPHSPQINMDFLRFTGRPHVWNDDDEANWMKHANGDGVPIEAIRAF
jgi:RHS repeat-associated protein